MFPRVIVANAEQKKPSQKSIFNCNFIKIMLLVLTFKYQIINLV